MKIYVASSWRNSIQPSVVEQLRAAGHEVYDFKHPQPGDNGFHWSEIDGGWQNWTPDQYRKCLSHPIAERGYLSDFKAMQWADAFVGVMPFGRSASMEMGWAAGQGKLTILLLADGEPELMVKMFDHICISMDEALIALEQGTQSRAERVVHKFTCPRRSEGPWFDQDNQDEWESSRWNRHETGFWPIGFPQPRTCSYCGGVHQADLIDLLLRGWEMATTGKGYKYYLQPPGYHQMHSNFQRGLAKSEKERGPAAGSGDRDNDVFSILSEIKSPTPPVKVYSQHLREYEEGKREVLADIINRLAKLGDHT